MTLPEAPIIRWAVDLPARAGRVIGIAPYRGSVLIACEYAIYEYEADFYTARGRLRVVDGQLWELAQAELKENPI